MSFFAQTPGGPGIPPGCAVPVIDVSGPLSEIPPAQRGATKELCPPDGGIPDVDPFNPWDGVFRGKAEVVVDARSWPGCVSPQTLVVTLGRSRSRRADRENGPHRLESIDGQLIMPRLRAYLEWGVGGSALQTAVVDFLHGTQLTIAAERVTVNARYDVVTPPWSGLDPDPCDLPIYEVSAGVSYGSMNRNTNPGRLTEIVQLETTDAVTRLAIPNFAASFTVLLRDDDSAIDVTQLAFGTAYSTLHRFTSPTSNQNGRYVENSIPLWGGAEFLEITNKGDGSAIAQVIFGLTI